MKTLLSFLLIFSTTLTYAKLAYEDIIPDHIPKEEIVCVELLEHDDASSIYLIETANGEVLYQVVSVVAMKLLPNTLELVCIAAIKNPTACKFVKLAGEALISLYRDEINEILEKFWTTKVIGSQGIAKVLSYNISDAKDSHQAFKVSKEKTGYPWSAPVIERYRDMNFGY